MIRIHDATKRFHHTLAVDRLTLSIEPGEVVALLGPNGSGKTTTLKMAAGLVRPDAGAVTIGDPPRPASDPVARRAISVSAAARRLPGDTQRPRSRRVLPPPAGRGGGAGGRGAAIRVAQRRGRTRGRHLFGRNAAAPRARGRDASERGRVCCSTSPPPRSTPTACARSTRSSQNAGRRGARFSSPPTRWTTWILPIAPSSWRRDALRPTTRGTGFARGGMPAA